MPTTTQPAIAAFGANAKQKLANPSITGEPEDQLRAPFEQLLGDMAELVQIPRVAGPSRKTSAPNEESPELFFA
jgi:hypothetical protein